MAELYRHTDEDGAWIEVQRRSGGDLMVAFGDETRPGCYGGADVPEVDGRRLLAALLRYYGSEEITKEEERRG